MAAINLTKGGRINLTKDNSSLKKIRISLGWKPNAFDSGYKFDLDASMFICKHDPNGDPKLIDNEYLIFYGNHSEPEGAVVHSGDNRDGEGNDPFDEHIVVDIAKLHAQAAELSIVVTIHDAENRRQNFGQVSGSVIALFDEDTGAELARYSLEDDFSNETALQFGSLVKKDGNWIFKAVGMGYVKGLADFVIAYGGELA